jgi:hypothetical protein
MESVIVVEELFIDEDEEKRKQRINGFLLALIRKSAKVEKR